MLYLTINMDDIEIAPTRSCADSRVFDSRAFVLSGIQEYTDRNDNTFIMPKLERQCADSVAYIMLYGVQQYKNDFELKDSVCKLLLNRDISLANNYYNGDNE